jgi:phospholipase C
MRSSFDRRSRRSTALALGALIVLAACTTASTSDTTGASPSDSNASVVQNQVPVFPGDDLQTKWPIKHVVIVMQENRSFDHMFGTFPGADGVSVGLDDGQRRPLTHLTAQRIPDVPHCWVCATTDYNHGKMDGFNQDPISDTYAYTQLHRSDEPNYWSWAANYTLADHFFSAERGPSYANHLYTISGQSAGAHDNPSRHKVLGSLTWGCDSPPKEKVRVVDEHGHASWVRPCFDIPTIEDRLRDARIPWSYYSATSTQPGYVWSAFSSIKPVFYGNAWKRHVFPVDQVTRDIGAGSLASVSWIMPRFQLSDHPGSNFC